jgi:hypothetical protein
MKKFLLSVFICCLAFSTWGQNLGNEWINYSQKYYFFKVHQSNVYRISASTLTNAGIPVASIDHRQLQLFGRGQEVPIFVQDGGTPNILDGSDFIEFYAQANDGYFDAPVYKGSNIQPNPYYSLINDTALYYITWNTSLSNKRISYETDNNFASYTASPFFFREIVQSYTSTYYRGEPIIAQETDADFTSSQGFFDAVINSGGTRVKDFATTNAFASGPNALFKTVVIGASRDAHQFQVEYRNASSNFVQIHNEQFSNYAQVSVEKEIAPGSLHASQTSFRYTALAGNRTTIAWASLKYPHSTNLGAANIFEMIIPDHSSQAKSYYEFSNVTGSGDFHLHDVTNGRKIRVYPQSGIFRLLVPNGSGEKRCILRPDSSIPTITNLRGVNNTGSFRNLQNLNADYLLITANPLWNAAKEYEVYRRSKGYKAETVNVEELYHQFAHGIHKNPLAIRNFAAYAFQQWAVKPEYLFLVGKAINIEESRRNTTHYANNLVPTYGVPSSDILLTSGINNTMFQPAIATGRVAAAKESDVRLLLNKIKEYEANTQPQEWMKNILHFGGGNDGAEQSLIVNYLSNYQRIIEDTLFGGKVHTFLKNTPAPIQMTLADKIKSLVNSGVSLMTFFGHASGNGFDVNIDAPENYSNKGKYPLLIANSCFSGDIHQPFLSTSESFVFIPEKGVIGFIAKVGSGFASPLNIYTNQFYRNISQLNYGETIGKTMQKTIADIQMTGNVVIKNQCELMTLHGDPALVLNSFLKPDITLQKSDIFFSPFNVTTQVDSFNVNVILTNLARATNLPFSVELIRKYQNGSTDRHLKQVNGLNFKDTLIFRLPVKAEIGTGENEFFVFADVSQNIEELNENNNQASAILKIGSTDIIPVYPYDFSIVPNKSVVLKFNTSDLFAPSRKYILEVDTTDLFNSPIKERKEVASKGGVVSWQPQLLKNMADSTVYYWRGTPLADSPADFRWRESSFRHISGKEGWGQKQFYQFKNNNFEFIDYNRTSRKFEYKEYTRVLKINNIGNPSLADVLKIDYHIDQQLMDYGTCQMTPAILLVVIDPKTLKPWEMKANANCREAKYFVFYTTNAAHMDSLARMMKDSVPYGHYLAAYSAWRPLTNSWTPLLKQAFQDLGASPALLANNDSIPFIFFVQKGHNNTAQTMIGTHSKDVITMTSPLIRNFPYGEIESPVIGPALAWDTFEWQFKSLETPSTDSLFVEIIGINKNGSEQLIQKIEPPTTIVSPLSIDPQIYPYIKLRAKIGDRINETPAQITDWKVYYKEAPEATIDPSAFHSFIADTLEEGDLVKYKTAIRNIGRTDFDSLSVIYYIEDKDRKIVSQQYRRIKPLKADSLTESYIEFPTVGIPGKNHLFMEVNPKDSKWQTEHHHFNNRAYLGFFVTLDKLNPLLDVTFDGVHILNGDIVSARPNILIGLKDENKYRALNDTSNFAIYLKHPDGKQQRVYFMEKGQAQLIFHPAALPKNSCRIEYRPKFSVDGDYELRIQARDAANNPSGSNDYVVNFKIINRSTITEVLNYPNPFSTSTRFVFTLTGSELPSHFKIQIMTIAGTVVKEIHMSDLGPIRIGRNITEYAWDGRDEFGDRLANGVYLYRVVTKINGQAIEQNQTEASQYFHKGIGKMFLMR